MKLSEMLGISYPAAGHLGHRVRAMVVEANLILSGVVDIDEMYVGAPPRKRPKSSGNHDDDEPPLAVNHSAREYARTDAATGKRVHVNRVESFNEFMRRAVTGA